MTSTGASVLVVQSRGMMTEHAQLPTEFEQSMTIHASPDAIFDFVTDVRNMPAYLPTARRAEPQQGDHVRVQGEAAGHPYDADGYIRTDPARYTMEWGADEHDYAGRLHITPEGSGASNVTVRLVFKGQLPGAGSGHEPSRADIEAGIRAALQSIENHVTGRGGKTEPPTATERR